MNRRHLLTCLTATLTWTAVQAANEAPQPNDIVVGQIGPFTVLPAPDARELNEGIKAGLAEINAHGGIQGRKVFLFELDDTYSPDGFRKQFAAALERKPVALLSPVGSAALKGALDDKLFDSADIVIINAVPGSDVLRTPGHPKLFHIRASDKQQIRKIVEHARSLNIQSMAVLHQDLPIGTSGLASAQEAAKEVGDIQVSAFKSTVDASALAQAAKTMAASDAHSGLVVGNPKFIGDGIAALRKAGFSRQLFTLSYMPAPALLKVAGSGARGVGIAQTYPNPMGVNLPLQRDFRSAMKAAHPNLTNYTTFHLEGYVTARVFAEAARRSKKIAPDGLAQALHEMGELNLGGFRVNFAKGNVGSSFVDIGVVMPDGKLMY